MEVSQFEPLVLAAVMDDPDMLPIVLDKLPRGEYFSIPQNRIIYDTIIRLAETNRPYDYINVLDAVEGKVEASYLAGLDEGFSSAPQVTYYAGRIRDAAVERQIRAQLQEGLYELEQKRDAPIVVIDRVVQKFYSLRVSKKAPFVSTRDLGVRVLKELESPDSIPRVPTGLRDVDRTIGEIAVPSFWVVAGRPSMGKSALAMNIAFNAAVAGHGVGIVTLETSPKQIYLREVARATSIENRKLQRANLHETDYPKIVHATGKIHDLPVWILDDTTDNWPDVRMLLRYEVRKRKIELVVVDYVQLLRDDSERWGGGYQEAKHISMGLKSFAKEENVAMLVVSQLNRQVEMRADKRPRMGDLREDGTLEQHADVICLLYRDRYYNPEGDTWAELNFDKNKDGRTGLVRMYYDEEHCAFLPLEIYHAAEPEAQEEVKRGAREFWHD